MSDYLPFLVLGITDYLQPITFGERMHTVGLVHPERDAGAHGPEGER